MKRFTIESVREKLKHAGFQKYLKNTGWLFFARILNLAVSFFTSILVIRYLGPTNNGALSYAVGFVGLFSIFANLGIEQILYRELIKKPEDKDKLLGTSFFIRIIGSVFAIILISIISFFTENDTLSRTLIIINSFTLFFASFNVIGYYFQAQVLAKYQALGSIIGLTSLSLLKLVVIFLDKGVIYFSIVLALENIIYAIVAIYFYHKQKQSILNWKFDYSFAKILLNNSWPLLLSSAFVLIYTRIDQVMIKHMMDTTSVGIYDAAARLSELWYFIPALITNSLFPAIINAHKTSEQTFQNRLAHLYLLMFTMSIIIAIPVSLFSHNIINLLYGHAFLSASSILSIYVWSGVPVFLSIAISNYLLAENFTKIIFWSSFIGMASNVLLNLIFIPSFGMNGAAFATLISYSLVPISTLTLFKETRGHNKILLAALKIPFNLKHAK